MISRGLETEKWDIAQFPSRTVLTEQRVVDTGLLTPETIGPYGEFGAAFFALGMRRQISIPLNLGTRRAAIMAGFNRGHLASTDQDFLAGLVTKLVPLLLGRLREEESHRGRKLMNYANRAMRTLKMCIRDRSGWGPPRALRRVATWSTLTPSRIFTLIA